MKKTLFLFLISILLLACEPTHRNSFNGIGELKIGAKFDSIPSYKLFDKKEGNEFELNKFELSKDISYVENVNVKTENGRIYEVSFSTGKFTNEYSIDSEILMGAKETRTDGELGNTSYESYNGKVDISKFEYKDKDLAVLQGYYQKNYFYSDSKISMAKFNIEETKKDSIEKAEYIKDVKK